MAELWTGALAAVGGAAAERGGGGGGPARRRGRATATNLLYRRRSPSSDGTDAPRAAADCVGHASVDAARRYACITCGAHLADHADLVSKAFQGRHGRAYLFANVYVALRAGRGAGTVLTPSRWPSHRRGRRPAPGTTAARASSRSACS